MTKLSSRRKGSKTETTNKSNVFVVTFFLLATVFAIFNLRDYEEYTVGPSVSTHNLLGNEESAKKSIEPEALDCKSYLRDYRNGQVRQMEEKDNWLKSYVTRTVTSKSFYWSTHSPELDQTRASSFAKGAYYESMLSERIAEVFDRKSSEKQESIFLDVGGNIGWFSLLAAAHGASKVYMFEPNPANLVRTCESLVLNGWSHDDPSENKFFLIPKGVGNQIGKLNLYKVSEINPGSFSFNDKMSKKVLAGSKLESNVVGKIDIVTLDSFARSRGWFESKPSIGFFKLDVETFEPFVIDGATELFKSRIVELFELEMQSGETQKPAVLHSLEILVNSGYELYMHGSYKGPNILVQKKYENHLDLASDIKAKMYKQNLLFRKRDDWNV